MNTFTWYFKVVVCLFVCFICRTFTCKGVFYRTVFEYFFHHWIWVNWPFNNLSPHLLQLQVHFSYMCELWHFLCVALMLTNWWAWHEYCIKSSFKYQISIKTRMDPDHLGGPNSNLSVFCCFHPMTFNPCWKHPSWPSRSCFKSIVFSISHYSHSN